MAQESRIICYTANLAMQISPDWAIMSSFLDIKLPKTNGFKPKKVMKCR